jgi:hypothetical protein
MEKPKLEDKAIGLLIGCSHKKIPRRLKKKEKNFS